MECLSLRYGMNNSLFDEDFPYAAYEDSELGYRLHNKDLELLYNKSAIAYHYHYTSLDDACKRMIKVGESGLILAKKIGNEQKLFSKPLFRKILGRFKFIIYYALAKFYEKRAIKEEIFGYVIGYYGFIGMKKSRDRKV